MNMHSAERFVGIDVSKDTLDVATCPEQEHWVVSQDTRGIALLVKRLERMSVTLIVLWRPPGASRCRWRLRSRP
jgi:hypothetical protein